jgi:hypothetical protein
MSDFKPTHIVYVGGRHMSPDPCMILNWHYSDKEARIRVKFSDGDIITGTARKINIEPMKKHSSNEDMSYLLYRGGDT